LTIANQPNINPAQKTVGYALKVFKDLKIDYKMNIKKKKALIET